MCQDQPAWMMGLATATVAKYIMIRAYNRMVLEKKLPAMESLPVDRKEVLWDTAKDFATGRLTKQELVEFCRCLYVFDYFLNL